MRSPSRRRDWGIWVALRTFLVLIIAGVVPWPEQVNDLAIYREWAEGPLSQGRFPDDPMWQYPPLAGPVFRVGAALPAGMAGYALLFLAFDAAIMWMLDRASGTGPGRRPGARLWALAAVVTGPLLLARFDVVPTTFAVAAVMCVSRPGAAGALAAMGTWLKAWPLLVLSALRRADLPRGLVGFIAASAVIGALMIATTSDALGFLGEQRARGLQIESIWATPFLIARALGAPVDVEYRYGAHEIDAAWAPALAALAALTSVGLLAAVAVSRLLGRFEHLHGADVALAAVLFSVATSRVFSGQYFIWLLGLAAVCLNTGASRMRATVRLIVLAGLATQLVYPWLYSSLLVGGPLAVAVQVMRVGLMIAAGVTCGRILWSRSAGPPS